MSTIAGAVTLRAEAGASEFSWTWRLCAADGTVLASHRAELDPDTLPAHLFTDLYSELRWSDSNFSESSRAVGTWAAYEALGRPIMLELIRAAPAVVPVELPPDCRFLAGYPWELARGDGQSLAERGIAFEYRPAGASPAPAGNAPAHVRILAVLSQPVDGVPVSLRAVRNRLRDLAERYPREVTLRLVEFDATRERLRAELGDPDGWDVVHLSGHGAPGALILEHDDGTGDPCPADELAGLLRGAARPPRLVVVTACESAATSGAALFSTAGAVSEPVGAGLAWAVRDATGAGVVAMRYRASAELVDVLVPELYAGLIARGEPIAAAYRSALADIATSAEGTRPYTPPGLPTANPVLFGPTSAQPLAPPGLGPGNAVPPAERFVGRVPELRAAIAALTGPAPRPVHLHGMPGVGVEALARELHRRLGADAMITTGRFAPERGTALAVPVAPLGPSETLHLVWDSEPLRELARRARAGELGPDEMTSDEAGTALLIATEGHPGMFREMEELAGDPAAFVRAADAAAKASANGETPWLYPAAAAIGEWVVRVRESLPGPARLLAEVLAVGQPGEHSRAVVEMVWPRVFRRWYDEEQVLPATGLLDLLRGAGLLGTLPFAGPNSPPPRPDLHLHRAVAAALLAGMDPDARQVAHWAYAEAWFEVFRGLGVEAPDEVGGDVATRMSRAALAAAHHCVPLGEWEQALTAVRAALRYRPLDGTAVDVDRVMRSGQPEDERLQAAWGIGWAEARAWLAPENAVAALHEIRKRTAANGWNAEHLRATEQLLDLVKDVPGRLREQLTEELVEYAVEEPDRLHARLRRADLWRRTGAEDRAREEAQALVSESDRWQLREPALGILATIALGRGDVERSFDLQQKIDESHAARGAAEVERAGHWLRMAWDAMALGRGDDARELIDRCQAVYRRYPGQVNLTQLSMTRAFVELHKGDAAEAMEMAGRALRAGYRPPQPRLLVACHLVLARAIIRFQAQQPSTAGLLPLRYAAAHVLAAAFLARVVEPGSGMEREALALAAELPAPPDTFAELAATIDGMLSLGFGDLAARLVPDPDTLLRQLRERLT